MSTTMKQINSIDSIECHCPKKVLHHRRCFSFPKGLRQMKRDEMKQKKKFIKRKKTVLY